MSEIKINSQGEVKLFDSDNSNYIGLKAPGTVSSDQTFILPDADGSANNALKTDGSGNLGFVDVTTLVTSAIDWQSTLKTGDFTAVSGEGYFINTTSGAITATLPASPSAGNIVAFKDYAATFGTNALTVGRNSSNIQGAAVNSTIDTNRASVVLVYVDATKGWLYVQESNVQVLGPQYVTASGGTETTSGDFKIHTFTSSGTFTVSDVGNADGSTTVEYLVVAGGGSGGKATAAGGGGGAGGYRTNNPSPATGGLSVSAQAYPITVGGGGATQSSTALGNDGSNSIFSTITSAGGGGGGGAAEPAGQPGRNGRSGGSGGGGTYGGPPGPGSAPASSGGSGNTPPVSPPQGNNGGPGAPQSGSHGGGGGGGASAVGATGTSGDAGNGGDGSANTITGSSVSYSGGGGGGIQTGNPDNEGAGGAGGGGGGGKNAGGVGSGTAGSTNTGGGGGGSGPGSGGAGGSGVVIIRYKYQN